MALFSKSSIAILGAGSWGTALALHLARLNHGVNLWGNNPAHIASIQRERCNKRYLPGYTFSENINVTANIESALANCQNVIIATPSASLRSILTLVKPHLISNANIILACKGLDPETSQLLHHVVTEILSSAHPCAILSGPSFAKEVAQGLPTAVVLASHNVNLAQHLFPHFSSPLFRVYTSSDMVGVEVGGASKNIFAIATGMSDGMELGANARSALITRGMAEMVRLGLALGGQMETFLGLAGLGDLVLTCTDNQSRNRRFGLYLGQGKTIAEAQTQIGQVIEGMRNVEQVINLAKKYNIDMPISVSVWQVIQGEITPQNAFKNLLARASGPEY